MANDHGLWPHDQRDLGLHAEDNLHESQEPMERIAPASVYDADVHHHVLEAEHAALQTTGYLLVFLLMHNPSCPG